MGKPARLCVIVVAAGSGTRMGGLDKLFSRAGRRPLLWYAIAPFQACEAVERIVLVMSPENLARGRELVKRSRLDKVVAVVPGGERRQDSVRLGLEALGAGAGQGRCEYVAVHDGGRPVVPGALIERGLEAVRETGAAVPAVAVVNTVKEASADGLVLRTVDRSRLWAVQTPQFFRYDLLERAHREVTADVTDDAAMVEALGHPVRLFPGDRRNIKVTVPEDLGLVRAVLAMGGLK